MYLTCFPRPADRDEMGHFKILPVGPEAGCWGGSACTCMHDQSGRINNIAVGCRCRGKSATRTFMCLGIRIIIRGCFMNAWEVLSAIGEEANKADMRWWACVLKGD